MASDQQLLDYVLRLADSDLILAQRLGEWVGHGPVLEEDIALTNVGLDLLGQARLWFAYAGEVERRSGSAGRSEDEFAFMREGGGFRNLLLTEQPNGNYADTMARQFYFDHAHLLLLRTPEVETADVAARGGLVVADLDHVEAAGDLLEDGFLVVQGLARLIDVGELCRGTQADLAGIGLLRAGQHAAQGGLAGAVGSDDSDDATAGQAE